MAAMIWTTVARIVRIVERIPTLKMRVAMMLPKYANVNGSRVGDTR
jgi:hypothetical protein